MRTLAIVNQKGGCGKTTTAINLAALYARRGLRTLLVDMDPQSHCAAGLGVPEARIEFSIGDALIADHHAARGFDPATLVWEVARNLYLAPSTVMLSALEAPGGGLHALSDKDRRLESLLSCIGHHYDRCLIDCPPTIGLLTFNALRAAREALIPVETGFFSLRGAEKQWNTIQRMISHIGRPIACHLLATLHNPQSQLACNILAALRRQFAGQILPVVIREHEELREAASFGQPVLEYAPESEARRDFDDLADWLEDHALRPAAEIEVFATGADWPANGTMNGGERSHLPDESPSARGGGYGGGSATGSRAAELARRVHHLTARSTHAQHHSMPIEAAPPPAQPAIATAAPLTEATIAVTEVDPPPPIAAPFAEPIASPPNLSHLYGVRQTSAGALFVQPASVGESLSVIGDFNHWSASANRMRFNAEAGVFETTIKLAPGVHEYLLAVNGLWTLDPHNPRQRLNSYGEPNNLIEIREI